MLDLMNTRAGKGEYIVCKHTVQNFFEDSIDSMGGFEPP